MSRRELAELVFEKKSIANIDDTSWIRVFEVRPEQGKWKRALKGAPAKDNEKELKLAITLARVAGPWASRVTWGRRTGRHLIRYPFRVLLADIPLMPRPAEAFLESKLFRLESVGQWDVVSNPWKDDVVTWHRFAATLPKEEVEALKTAIDRGKKY
jgi:hypothetical protein